MVRRRFGANDKRAGIWLEENFDSVGVRSSFSLDRFLPWRAGARSRELPRLALGRL